jgi:hypothetical protein
LGVARRLNVLRVVSVDRISGDGCVACLEGLDAGTAIAVDRIVLNKDSARVTGIGVEDDAFAIGDNISGVGVGNQFGVVVGEVAADILSFVVLPEYYHVGGAVLMFCSALTTENLATVNMHPDFLPNQGGDRRSTLSIYGPYVHRVGHLTLRRI